MLAILWKELRENLKWAVLWALGVAAVMAYTLHEKGRPTTWDNQALLLTGDFPMITLLGAMLAGGLLGLAQSVPERRRDQWAFLLHRPATPTEIFAGKVIAGLLLYGAAMLLPLLGAGLWKATAGHAAAPFTWRELLPGVADVLAGTAFYFAGLLTGLREARWFGSRPLPFVPAVLCAMLVAALPVFWAAATVAVVGAVVLAVAAWGSFVASGQYRSQPAPAKPVLGLVLLAALLCIAAVAAIVGGTLLSDPNKTYSRYWIDKDGNVLRLRLLQSTNSIISMSDLAGHPIDAYNGMTWYELHEKNLLSLWTIRDEPDPRRVPGYRSSDRFAYSLSSEGAVHWYYVPAEHLLVGYDKLTRRRIGSIGPEGFQPIGAEGKTRFPAEQLLNTYWYDARLLIFPSGAYWFDLGTRQVRLLVAGTEGDPVVGASFVHGSQKSTADAIAVVTAQRIHLFSDPSGPSVSFPLGYPPEQFPNMLVGIKADGHYLFWYQASYFLPWSQRAGHVLEVTPAGQLVQGRDLPPIRPDWWVAWMNVVWALLVPIAGPVLALVGLFAFEWVSYGWPMAADLLRDMRQELSISPAAFWAAVAVVLLVEAALWSAVVYGIARRYRFAPREAAWWMAMGFAFGPAGLLTMLALREWPARAACASCGQMRLVDREHCDHCHAPWPPARCGETEIFDTPQAVDPLATRT